MNQRLTANLPTSRDLLWSGYGPLKEACFLLLQVTDAAAARAWLGSMVESVTTIEQLRQTAR